MPVTPIFDQLCRELGDPTRSKVSTEATDIGSDAVAEPELEPVPSLEETTIEWSVPKERVA